MARTRSGSTSTRFKARDKVRVKHGVRDPDFADIPLGGWSGSIKEVEPYKGEILPHRRFKTVAEATPSPSAIYQRFEGCLAGGNFPGADMAR